MYTQIKTKQNYDKLLSSGMFFEFHPELTGNFEKDMIIIKHNMEENKNIESSYPNDVDIDKMVEDFTKDLIISNSAKATVQFGFQEGMYKMLEIWKHQNTLINVLKQTNKQN